jgi:hypothetical protein
MKRNETKKNPRLPAGRKKKISFHAQGLRRPAFFSFLRAFSDFVGFDGLLFWGFAPSPFCPIGRILLFPAAEKVNKKAPDSRDRLPLKKKLLKMHSVSLKSFKLVRLLPDRALQFIHFFYAFFLRRNVSDCVGFDILSHTFLKAGVFFLRRRGFRLRRNF